MNQMSEKIQDDASLWWENRHLEVQEFEQPEEVPSFLGVKAETGAVSQDSNTEQPEANRSVTDKDVKNKLNGIKINKPMSELIASLIELILPIILALIFKTDKDSCEFDDEEHELMADAWAQYLESADVKMSPGTTLAITMASICGVKAFEVYNNRKAKEAENLMQEQYTVLQHKYCELARKIESESGSKGLFSSIRGKK